MTCRRRKTGDTNPRSRALTSTSADRFQKRHLYTHVVTTKENIDSLEKVIDLILIKLEHESKRTKFKDAYTVQPTVQERKKNIIGTLGKKSIDLILDSLGCYHFEEAAKLLWVYCQSRQTSCFSSFLYRCMMSVSENIEFEEKNEAVMKLNSVIQNLDGINKLEVQLEFILYALKNDFCGTQDDFEKITGNRFNQFLKRIPHLDCVLNAYCSLLDYVTFCRSCQDGNLSALGHSLVDKVISGLKNVIEYPGTWDIFVLKLIKMLEILERYEEIEEILKKYVENNPDHANAYIYLCVYLHKTGNDPKSFVRHAKELCKLCPSDPRVLLLVQFWNEQGKKLKERLKILFMFMDYPVNGNSKLGWQLLASHLLQAANSEKPSSKQTVESLWSFRAEAWNRLHFISADRDNDLELIEHKKKMIYMLEGANHPYITEACKILKSKASNLEYRIPCENVDCFQVYRLDDDFDR